MKLVFLGTSAGKPTKERNVSALGIRFEQQSKWYLFDCGEGTQRQILNSPLSLGKLDSIFITHLHGDHYYGLPGLLSTKKLDDNKKSLNIFAPNGIKKFLECAIDISEEKLGYKLNIIEYKYEDEFSFEGFTLKVLPLIHSKESSAFYIQNQNENISFIIAGDNSVPAVLEEYLKEIDLLVHECTFTQDVYEHMKKKVMHTTAKELGITAEKMGVKNLIANHINPRYCDGKKLNLDMVYDEIRLNYKGKLFLADDFEEYHLDKNGLIKEN